MAQAITSLGVIDEQARSENPEVRWDLKPADIGDWDWLAEPGTEYRKANRLPRVEHANKPYQPTVHSGWMCCGRCNAAEPPAAPVAPKAGGFAAKFSGRCVRCSLPIVAGQMIVRDGVKFPHLDCSAAAEESQAAEFDLWVRTHGDAPVEPIVGLDLSVLPLGDTHYAVPAADGHLVFLVAQRPESGKWLGWTFVKQFLGGQGPAQRLGSQKPGSAYKGQWIEMLTAVLADPKAAAETFARELGICYICSRDLTDETSRALGIGPVCREKGGF